MDKDEVCKIIKAVAEGLLKACQTMEESKERPDGKNR